MKKISFLLSLLVSVLLIGTISAYASTNTAVIANLNKVKLLINGNQTELYAYNINGSNYFKIRDLCKALNFKVEYDNTLKAVWIETYNPNQNTDENNNPTKQAVSTTLVKSALFCNAYDDLVNSCNIDGNNYFMLREFADLTASAKEYTSNAPYIEVNYDNTLKLININVLNRATNNQVVASETASTTSDEKANLTEDEFTKEVIRLTNEERAKVGAPPLKLDDKLCEVAHLKAKELIELDYTGHDSPNYGNPTEFAKHYGWKGSGIGENLYYGFAFETPNDLVQGWMNSKKGHRENMLNPKYTLIGHGRYSKGTGEEYESSYAALEFAFN